MMYQRTKVVKSNNILKKIRQTLGLGVFELLDKDAFDFLQT